MHQHQMKIVQNVLMQSGGAYPEAARLLGMSERYFRTHPQTAHIARFPTLTPTSSGTTTIFAAPTSFPAAPGPVSCARSLFPMARSPFPVARSPFPAAQVPFPLYRDPFQLHQGHFRCEQHMNQSERRHFRREIDQMIRKLIN
jgi:hypothetical protein